MATKTSISDIQQLGNLICKFLDSIKIPLTGEEDGRLESLNSENEITNRIRLQFPDVQFLEKGCNREFGDITAVINGQEFPINVKMVNPEKSGTFNGGGPKTFNYVLFGETKQIFWNKLAKKIVENQNERQYTIHPYYYLIYYKNSTKKTMFCSLTDVSHESIVTNPSNPLQLKKEIKPVERTEEEKIQFITSLFKECARKRAEAYLILTNSL